MSSKQRERDFLDQMLRDLKWHDMEVQHGGEPPDFILISGDSRIAVEVTRIFRREGSKGSAAAAQEREYDRFVQAMVRAYYDGEPHQLVQVKVAFPPVIASPHVRQFSREERRADEATVMRRAVARLRHLRKLSPGEGSRFQVRCRDGRPATFHVLGLSAGLGMERRWQALNNSLGWVGTVDSHLLQEKVASKARGLSKYRSPDVSPLLLVVADGSRASGYLELSPDIAIDPSGFDAVYFQRYPYWTRLLPSLAIDGNVPPC